MFRSNQDDLATLKREFEKAIGAVHYSFSDDELRTIFREIEKLPFNRRSIENWQVIATNVTGYNRWLLTKALDLSDINDLHRRIQDILKR